MPRYYDSNIGRFISADGEISDVGGNVLVMILYNEQSKGGTHSNENSGSNT